MVFIWLNSVETHAADDMKKALPYLVCLMAHPTKPDPCFALGQELFVNQSTVIAILIMLSVSPYIPASGIKMY